MNMREIMALVESAGTEVHWMVPRARSHSIRDGEYVAAWIDVARLNASWSKDSCYVGPNGADGIGRRYAAFGEWLAEGNGPVEMPEVALTVWGYVGFGNGRHRFSWMRDHGVTALPVLIPVEDAEAFEERFGTSQRQSILRR